MIGTVTVPLSLGRPAGTHQLHHHFLLASADGSRLSKGYVRLGVCAFSRGHVFVLFIRASVETEMLRPTDHAKTLCDLTLHSCEDQRVMPTKRCPPGKNTKAPKQTCTLHRSTSPLRSLVALPPHPDGAECLGMGPATRDGSGKGRGQCVSDPQ